MDVISGKALPLANQKGAAALSPPLSSCALPGFQGPVGSSSFLRASLEDEVF